MSVTHSPAHFSLACCCVLLAGLAWPGLTDAQDGAAAARPKFAAQGSPVDRARAFPKYGDVLVRELRKVVTAGDFVRAEEILTEYRDLARQLHANLRAAVPDPEKRSNGFKQLQIHVRKTTRDAAETLAAVPVDLRPPFQFLRDELDRLDRALIEDLFPRRPERDKKKEKAGN
jgi:hypothetical protein